MIGCTPKVPSTCRTQLVFMRKNCDKQLRLAGKPSAPRAEPSDTPLFAADTYETQFRKVQNESVWNVSLAHLAQGVDQGH